MALLLIEVNHTPLSSLCGLESPSPNKTSWRTKMPTTTLDKGVVAPENIDKPRITRRRRIKQEREVLLSMKSYVWYRPLDLGGSNKSFHTRALMRLCTKGLVEFRQRATKS